MSSGRCKSRLQSCAQSRALPLGNRSWLSFLSKRSCASGAYDPFQDSSAASNLRRGIAILVAGETRKLSRSYSRFPNSARHSPRPKVAARETVKLALSQFPIRAADASAQSISAARLGAGKKLCPGSSRNRAISPTNKRSSGSFGSHLGFASLSATAQPFGHWADSVSNAVQRTTETSARLLKVEPRCGNFSGVSAAREWRA